MGTKREQHQQPNRVIKRDPIITPKKEVADKKNRSGTPRIPMRDGGPQRPATHSGKRLKVHEWMQRIDEAVAAATAEQAHIRIKREAPDLCRMCHDLRQDMNNLQTSSTDECAELLLQVAALETALRDQQADLQATSAELERSRERATDLERHLAAAIARNGITNAPRISPWIWSGIR